MNFSGDLFQQIMSLPRQTRKFTSINKGVADRLEVYAPLAGNRPRYLLYLMFDNIISYFCYRTSFIAHLRITLFSRNPVEIYPYSFLDLHFCELER